MAIILSDGIGLFEALPEETTLKLESSKTYDSGAIGLKYSVE
jgi:hypothetical protein